MPSVPSEPINKFVKLYPAAVFLVLVPVFIISPDANIIVNPETIVFIVPYFTAIVPEAEVAVIPPIEASAPGSIGKKRPLSFNSSFNCFLVTQAWTLQSKSLELIDITLFIFSKERVIPSVLPTTLPSRDVPVPKEIIGVLNLLHNLTI